MQNPMTEQMLERLVGGVQKTMRLGASGAKIAFSHAEHVSCSFENGRLKSTGSSETCSFAISCIANGRKGSTSGNDPDRLDLLIEQALALARVGSAAHFAKYPQPRPLAPVSSFCADTAALSRERLIEACERAVAGMKTYDPDLYLECGADKCESEGAIVTSGGLRHATTRTDWNLGAFAQRTHGTDMVFCHCEREWGKLNDFFDPDVIAEHIVSQLKWSEKTVAPPMGKVKAFVPGETLELLLYPLALGINGRNVAKGDSPLAGRMGQQVLAPELTIEDRPHTDHAPGAARVDGDGIPTRNQIIFNKGVLERFLYDLDSAGLAGAEPTGNAGCSPYWPILHPGAVPARTLLAGIEDGLYVKDLIGFGQSNIVNGDFSCNVGLGYRIRRGEIVGRVKDVMIAGNVYDLFGRSVALSSDTDYDGRFPSAVIEGLSVSA